MPLHDWTGRGGWEGVHHLWIAELMRWIKPRLPAGYRVYIGSPPVVAVGAPTEKPDVGVRQWPEQPAPAGVDSGGPSVTSEGPDEEVAVALLEPEASLFVERIGRLVAAVELVSPRNKDRPVARAAYLARYVGYLLEGVHLLLVDVHPRPSGFSFADRIAQELQMGQPTCPPPMAVSYRVGEPAATGGRILAIWRRPLTVDAPLPNAVLPLTTETAVTVDLEQTYQRAVQDAYLA
jgi:hypothetical protein